MKRNFDEWLSTFKTTIYPLEYYVDFEKVYKNAEKYKKELFLLNSLIGVENIEDEFKNLVSEYPKVVEVIPTLLAVRKTELYAIDEDGEYFFEFQKHTNSVDEYCTLMYKTGLFDLISKHIVNNLYDYVLGVEVGLDSNARKNRGGHVMEDLVEKYIKKAGFTFSADPRPEDVNVYAKEMNLSLVEEIWGVDLSSLSNEGETEKRFDFVVRTESYVYCIETNFYASGGSKLNETARSYKMLALESQHINNFKFVWFTDGSGWKSAWRNLKETFDVFDDVYNVSELENNIVGIVFE